MRNALPPVYLYGSHHPQETGSGMLMRFYSNTRAFRDLGYQVESVQITTDATDAQSPAASLGAVPHTTLVAPPATPPWLLSRLLYRMGVPHRWSLGYYFPCHEAVREAVLERERRTPGAIHVVANDSHANAILSLPPLRMVYGLHDIGTEMVERVQEIARESRGGRPLTAAERRERRFAGNFQRKAAARARAVFCGSLHDLDVVREWRVPQAEFIPCSMADESLKRRFEPVMEGPLRLVHIGRVDHLPSFRSLEFLLGRVWPSLPASLRARLRLRVIGTLYDNNRLCDQIRELAAPYPEVELAGFVRELDPEFAAADLQLILSTAATGCRVRIIQSFAAGVPVLSSSIAADGIAGLQPAGNILLADSVDQTAALLETLVADRQRLPRVASAAADTYRRHYSRPVAAARIAEALGRWLPEAAPPEIAPIHGTRAAKAGG